MNEKLNRLYDLLRQIEYRTHAIQVLNYDMETQAPQGGMEDDGRDVAFLSEEIFRIEKSEEFLALVDDLYKEKETLGLWDQRLITLLKRQADSQKPITPEFDRERTELFNQSYVAWLQAKEKNDYTLFENNLKRICESERKYCELEKTASTKHPYDILLSQYEHGFTSEDLDVFFDELEQGIAPLLRKVKNASYQPRHDFLNRRVPIAKQEVFSRFLMEFNGFDFRRGSLSTTEHPFTSQFSYNDVRITTHYFENNVISNMYSIIHEGGHALFGQNVKEEVFTHYLGENSLSLAKHESVSRFYENVIGRSREYIHAIYPEFQKIFKEEMSDISEQDLYEGVNYVDFSNFLRTEADELTYSLHILIRYRLEKAMLEGKVDFDHLDEEWNRLYKEILSVENHDAKTGILQDVHWTSGFGYFPTYSMGNALNCMYIRKMKKELPFSETIASGNMKEVLSWMKENVFATAPLYDTKEWIKNLTGEEFSAKDYIEYLTKKFTEIYHL